MKRPADLAMAIRPLVTTVLFKNQSTVYTYTQLWAFRVLNLVLISSLIHGEAQKHKIIKTERSKIEDVAGIDDKMRMTICRGDERSAVASGPTLDHPLS